MLGIGFIIAHFVAMQKPQQRKYHSSCNRSVHRGTAHGKQEVKVCKRKTPHLLVRSFLSPCGDCTGFRGNKVVKFRFSPPYGDGIVGIRGIFRLARFSPPYGDCTVPTSARARCSPFSPPYGDRTTWVACPALPTWFSPPCGDRTYMLRFLWLAQSFSPPYGDGTR